MQSYDPFRQFEDIVERIFLKQDFSVKREVPFSFGENFGRYRADLVVEHQGSRTVVEVKLYRTRSVSLGDLRKLSDHMLRAQGALSADHAMIVTNIRTERLPDLRLLPPNIVLMPFDELITLAEGDPDLLEGLATVETELNSALGDFDRAVDLSPAPDRRALSKLAEPSTPPLPTVTPPGKGFTLAQELREIPPGKAHHFELKSKRSGTNWVLFEDVCYEALQYIFDRLIANWTKQQPVGGADQRFDALGKIIGADVFSRTLIEDFRTRHVLFEFKNYTEQLKPNLIHVTEKYLFPTALRSTAIIISPKGFSEEATRAAQGALRDAGKLMLDLPVDTLCDMLIDADIPVAPTGKMELLLDSFLQSLGR